MGLKHAARLLSALEWGRREIKSGGRAGERQIQAQHVPVRGATLARLARLRLSSRVLTGLGA